MGVSTTDGVNGATAKHDVLTWMRDRLRGFEMDLRVSVQARVLAYDPITQKASVMVESLPIKNTELGPVPDKPIITPPIPVEFDRGMEGLAYQTYPLVPGDTGKVSFQDRDISAWLQSPKPGPVDPISGLCHSLASGVFRPGLHQDADPIVPPTSMTSHVIEGPLVDLGRLATDFALRGTPIVTAAAALVTTMTALPPAGDLVTTAAAANANSLAILTLSQAIVAAISTKVRIQ